MTSAGHRIAQTFVFRALVAIGVAGCHIALAQEAKPPGAAETIVITGARTLPSDREIAQRVQTSLESDKYLDASHITVSVNNGVLSLEGVVNDVSDLMRVIRISNRITGVKRVDLNLDMPDFDDGP